MILRKHQRPSQAYRNLLDFYSPDEWDSIPRTAKAAGFALPVWYRDDIREYFTSGDCPKPELFFVPNLDMFVDGGSAPDNPVIDLPFPVCLFQGFNTPLFSHSVLKNSLNDERDDQGETYGFMVCERSPGDYIFASAMTLRNTGGMLYNAIITSDTNNKASSNLDSTPIESLYNLYVLIAQAICEKMRSPEIAKGEKPKVLPYVYGKSKSRAEIKRAIYIGDRKYYESQGHRDIDWSHKWYVRGHWRRIGENQIGKDRTGEYVIPHFTWVIPHEKGTGELISKTRVLKSTGP